MQISFIISTAALLFMLLDPFGNLPVFITLLRGGTPRHYTKVIFREGVFSLAAMLLSLLMGRSFLHVMHISSEALAVGGGLILLIMGIKMVFSQFSEDKVPDNPDPFIVPIAIPYICDPGLMSILITLRGSNSAASLRNCSLAVLLSWCAMMVVLLFGRSVQRVLGNRVLDAIESLLGLFLICMSVEMIINGINTIYGLPIIG